MSAHENFLPPYGDDEVVELAMDEYTKSPSQRIAGWSGANQARFLRALADGATVGQACRLVGLTQQSAYAFRHSARGTQFGIGWQAALLHARNHLADVLMERALHGNVETITRPDGGEVERHRFDNRLGMAMLNRLDRMADKAAKETTHAAARLVAQEFEPFLDLVSRDAGPARAGLFLARRVEAANEDDLAPVRALARADHWLRTHTDLAEPLALDDLDPDARQAWSGEQWLRAEAAGLVEIAPAQAKVIQAIQDFPDGPADDDEPVWWDEEARAWRTHFPPPRGFRGEEEGEYGEEGYERELSPEEEEALDAPMRAEVETRRALETEARDRWFAALAVPPADDPAAAVPAEQPAP